ncbi:DUF4281 domain-containing protein [Aliikangiella coralliicola]|uniref:DUF4281 domain-containing protein n=1 Tax=Aliikangiella coralliicola TaxID=2592383 RepID=A0A545UK63_9GAMM|nr:DUF4281 domain-containing protein [Aliikangiella coralliicola]
MGGGLSAQQIFGWAGQAALIGWLVLIFLPRRIKLIFAIPQYLIPVGLGIVYSGLALSRYFAIEGGYSSLEQVKLLFQDDFMLLAGWIHYLAFDLFIGAWIAKQADQLGISRLLQAPILVATFMFGPVGLVIFFCIKAGFFSLPRVEIKEVQHA